MSNEIINPEELIINKCLIIDDNFDEVKDIIFKLNNYTISTDYREDVLKKGVKIDPNIQLVILDLYMSVSQDSFDDALSSVAFLNENIKGPYFLLIWTKHEDRFDQFFEELCKNYSDYDNFPLDIERLSTTKNADKQDLAIAEKAVNDIIEYINEISKKYTNIYYYLKLTKIFQKQSTMFWRIFKPDNMGSKKNPKEFSDYYEDILGKAFYSFDKAFNYEKSGKGFLNIHAKFLEHELTVNRIDYGDKYNGLDERFKENINSRLVIHNFDSSRPADALPGLIYKEDKVNQDKIMEEFFETVTLEGIKLNVMESLEYKFFNLKQLFGKNRDIKNLNELLAIHIDETTNKKILDYFKNIEGFSLENPSILNQKLKNILLSKIEIGKLVITPYCDFAQEKKKDILYLPTLIIKGNFKDRSKFFKSNVKFQDLHNGKYLAYVVSMYNVCELERLGKEIYSFYLSKEYVNEIQINVANNISRIGTTIID